MNHLQIAIGSLNQTKVLAVKETFQNIDIIPVNAPSGVAEQPFGDNITKRGAIHRAEKAKEIAQTPIGIGLEGGVMLVDKTLFLCNWGAMVTENGKIFNAAGARIELPACFTKSLKDGTELSVLMDAYTKKENIRHHEGAIGIFTNNRVARQAMFTHVVTLLKGQYEYWTEDSCH